MMIAVSTSLRNERVSGLSRTVVLAAVALVCSVACGDDSNEESSTGALEGSAARRATWAAAPQDYNEVFPGGVFPPPEPLAFSDQTLRQIVRTSVGGVRPRVRISNQFGASPLTIDGAHLAVSLGGSRIEPSSDTQLSFDGAATVTIPAGAESWSDPADLVLSADSDVAITVYVAGTAPVATVHSVALQTAFATAGEALSSAELTAAETNQRYHWITALDIETEESGGVIVAFGDSITDGVASTPDTNQRYPNLLRERLRTEPGLEGFGIVNEGISGNRVLSDVVGPSGVSRFERDVLGHSGVTHAIILIGINDIGFGGFMPDAAVSAAEIEAGLTTLLEQARAAGVETYLATLLPLKGTMPPYYGEQTEAVRGEVNAWIRSEAPADGVIDFDVVMQDPADPLQMLPAYASEDRLHPRDEGYRAMADAIDLSLFR